MKELLSNAYMDKKLFKMKNVEEYYLTSEVKVGQLKKWMDLKDHEAKKNIVNLIHHRFNNRYIKHARNIDSGFLKMAISCFMIETLESFKLGKKDTKRIGADMFKSFFLTEENHFPGFKEIDQDFYSNIRCGILHQAETKNGWRMTKTGDLLNRSEKSVNAWEFVNSLEKSMNAYIVNLNNKDFTDPLWEYAFIKLTDICENCKVTS